VRWGTPIAALLTAAAHLAPARAEEPPPDPRADVEWALLSGRVTDLPGVRPGLEPTAAMFGWRDGTGKGVRATGTPLQALHVAFARDAADQPVVQALLEDRDRRELVGFRTWDAGASPLARLPDPNGRIRWFLTQLADVHDPVRDEDARDPEIAEPARRRIARAHALRDAAGLWAAAALTGLVLLTLLAGFLVRPRSRQP
jgi:hypothetical protein